MKKTAKVSGVGLYQEDNGMCEITFVIKKDIIEEVLIAVSFNKKLKDKLKKISKSFLGKDINDVFKIDSDEAIESALLNVKRDYEEKGEYEEFMPLKEDADFMLDSLIYCKR